MTDEKAERFYKVRQVCGGPWCVMGLPELHAHFNVEADVTSAYEVEVVELTPSQVEALGEFPGW